MSELKTIIQKIPTLNEYIAYLNACLKFNIYVGHIVSSSILHEMMGFAKNTLPIL